MKRFSLCILLTLTTAGEVDPCWFIGLRLAKTPSSCVRGFCKGIIFQDNQVLPESLGAEVSPVTCGSASRIMQTYLAEQDFKRVKSESVDVSAVVELFAIVVNPDSRRMLLEGGTEPLEPATVAAMGAIDQILLQLFKESNEGEWRHIRDNLSRTETFESFLRLGDLIFRWIQTMRSRSEDVASRRTTFAHFFFDMFSLFGRQDGLMINLMAAATSEAISHPVEHRRRHEMESYQPIEFFGTGFRGIAVLMTETLVNRGQLSEKKIRALARSIVMIDSHAAPDQSAAVAILLYQLRSHLCPIIHEIVQASHLWATELVTETIAFINLCRGHAWSQRLIDASVSVSPRGHSPYWLRSSDRRLIIQNLKRNDVPWANGLGESEARCTAATAFYSLVGFVELHNPLVRKGQFNILRPKAFFNSEQDFEDTMKGLGRAIGLCARYTQPMGVALRLHPYFFQAIYDAVDPRLLLDLFELPEAEQRDWINEPIFFVRLGIQDVLGLAGLYVFPVRVWENLALEITPLDFSGFP